MLVVEDNALNQHVMRELLRRLGVDVTIVGEGGPVADLIGKRHFDVLLLDLQLPDIDGWQVAQQVRALPHGANLPIVFLSAHVDAHEERRAQALGAYACMGKPFEPAQLQALLVTLAARLRPQAPKGKAKGAIARQRKPAADDAPALTHPPARPPARQSLLRLFAQQWPDLRQAVAEAGDEVALRQAIHAVRGSLAVLNQPVLLSLARQHEEALVAGMRPLLADIESLLQQIDQLASSVA
ncbi:MAG: response regulator [Aquabacterium sp.]